MDENNQSNLTPPLDCDLNTVDISYPLAADGFIDLTITKVEVKATSKGGRMIALEHKNIGPVPGRKGEVIQANGLTLFNNVNTVPTGKSNWDIVKRGMAELIQAVPGGVPGAGLNNVDTWAPQLQGKVVRARVGFEAAGTVMKNGERTKKDRNILDYYCKAGS